MEKIRILFHINDFGKGGTESSLIAWSHALDRNIFSLEISIAFPSNDLVERHNLFPIDVKINVLAKEKWLRTLHDIGRKKKLTGFQKITSKIMRYLILRPVFFWRIRKLSKRFDIICDYDMTLRYLAGKFKKPWIGVHHYSFSKRLTTKNQHKQKKLLTQFLRYDAIGILTPAMLNEAKIFFGDKNKSPKLLSLPNVIDTETIATKSLEKAEKNNIKNPYIISVGRLDETQKDYSTLLKAYALLKTKNQIDEHLVIVGEGHSKTTLKQIAKDLKIFDSVHFIGFCENPYPYIKNSKLLVLSSTYEGFGMVLGEAMALNVPVVSTDCPTGPRDLLKNGECGKLVELNNTDALASAIYEIISDENLGKDLAKKALSRIQEFSPKNASNTMKKLCESLLTRQFNRLIQDDQAAY